MKKIESLSPESKKGKFEIRCIAEEKETFIILNGKCK